MAPRAYNLGRRQAATEQTRASILAAARALLVAPEGIAGFTLDAVAKQAGVARMTVYYQFTSKAGLIEALLDDQAVMRGRERLVAAMSNPDALSALDALIEAFAGFWTEDRAIQRRLQALSELDAEFSAVLSARGERMHQATRVLAERFSETFGHPAPQDVEKVGRRLAGLLGFRSFDAIAGEHETPKAIAPVVQCMARVVLGLPVMP